MNLWNKLFAGRASPKAEVVERQSSHSSAPKPSTPSAPAGKNYVVISATSENMVPIASAQGSLTTIQYDGGPAELFYERMSKELISQHGPLVGADYVSHWPKFEIWFRYKDGAAIYSGQRTGHHDIHFLTMGYHGEGPRYVRHFLAAAGFDLTSDQIDSIKPGDSIEFRDSKAVIVREKDKVVETQDVVFDQEEKRIAAGLPATYRYYNGPSKASAVAFLEKQNITARSFFIAVTTPDGIFWAIT